MKKYLLPLAVLPFAVVAIVFYLHRDTVEASSPAHWAATDPFLNYTTWRKTTPNYPDVKPILSSLGNFVDTNYGVTANKFSFVDINGDNLPDFLYHEKNTTTADSKGVGPRFYAIFLNNGNANFNLAYKCVIQYDNYYGYYVSYGDCGGPQLTDPNAPANQNMLSQVLTLANFTNYNYTSDPKIYTHLWIDINGDGLLDLIDTGLHINNNATGQNLLSF